MPNTTSNPNADTKQADENSDSSHELDWLLYLTFATIFGAAPFLVLGVSANVMLAVFCGVVASKWFIFAVVEFMRTYPAIAAVVYNKIPFTDA